LGFPAIDFNMVVDGLSWDASVYDGICQFQKAKGFNPYSQEVVTELGWPLFQVSCDRDVLPAHSKPRDYHLDSSVTLSQCNKMIPPIATRTQMGTVTQKNLKMKMSNMVCLGLSSGEFFHLYLEV
jgi:hypothetical protein